jgi:lipid A 4'-phosphatase
MDRASIALAVALAISALLFSLFPQIDMAVSTSFYGAHGFIAANNPRVELLRSMAWWLSDAMFLLALAALLVALTSRRLLFGIGRWTATYMLTLFLLGPVLLSNRLLKGYWGRARPADVADFGGAHQFTPFWLPSDQCLANCSFVSGEVSGTAVTAICMVLLRKGIEQAAGRVVAMVWTVIALLLPVVVSLQRITSGRHFLSDAVFAVLFMMVIALLLRPLLRKDDPA